MAGTARLGLSGHREQTGERVPRLLLALDGVADLLGIGSVQPDDSSMAPASDSIANSAAELLGRLATEGPAHGVHLLLADRVGSVEEQAALRDRLPAGDRHDRASSASRPRSTCPRRRVTP